MLPRSNDWSSSTCFTVDCASLDAAIVRRPAAGASWDQATAGAATSAATSHAEQRTIGGFIGLECHFAGASRNQILGYASGLPEVSPGNHGPSWAFPTIVRFAPETRWQPSSRRGTPKDGAGIVPTPTT